jgi:hypothetical protein
MQTSCLQAYDWLHYECRDLEFGALFVYSSCINGWYEHLVVRVQGEGRIIGMNPWRR